MSDDGIYVYILRCADGSYYTGTARLGLEKRVAQHNDATFGGYTACRRPVMLVFSTGSIVMAMASRPNVRSRDGHARKRKHWSAVTTRCFRNCRGEKHQRRRRERGPRPFETLRYREAPQGEERDNSHVSV